MTVTALAMALASGCNLSWLKGDLKLLFDLLLPGRRLAESGHSEQAQRVSCCCKLLDTAVCILYLYLHFVSGYNPRHGYAKHEQSK